MNFLIIKLFINFFLFFDYNSAEKRIVLDSIDNCDTENPNAADDLTLEINLNKETQAVSVRADLKVVFDKSFEYSAKLVLGPSSRITLAGDLCSDLNDLVPSIWKDVTKIAGVSHECPIPAGNYAVDNYVIPGDVNIGGLGFFTLDNFSMQFKIKRDGKVIDCKDINLGIK